MNRNIHHLKSILTGLTIYIAGDICYFAARQRDVTNIYTMETEPMVFYFDDVWKYKIKKIVAYSIHSNPDTENLVDILADYQWGFKEQVPPTERELAFRAGKQRMKKERKKGSSRYPTDFIVQVSNRK